MNKKDMFNRLREEIDFLEKKLNGKNIVLKNGIASNELISEEFSLDFIQKNYEFNINIEYTEVI